jgi:hypothetical protein
MKTKTPYTTNLIIFGLKRVMAYKNSFTFWIQITNFIMKEIVWLFIDKKLIC